MVRRGKSFKRDKGIEPFFDRLYQRCQTTETSVGLLAEVHVQLHQIRSPFFESRLDDRKNGFDRHTQFFAPTHSAEKNIQAIPIEADIFRNRRALPQLPLEKFWKRNDSYFNLPFPHMEPQPVFMTNQFWPVLIRCIQVCLDDKVFRQSEGDLFARLAGTESPGNLCKPLQ